jgi:cytochrome c-type biogenesis protein CcmH
VPLSSAKTVIVGARISKSGNATPQPGDLEGYSPPVAVGQANVKVEIRTVR